MKRRYLFVLILCIISNMLIAQAEAQSTSSSLVDSVLMFARSKLGCHYRHGGKGPNSFDCSGFTYYVFSQFGYALSASSSAQYYDGIPVSREQLQKGDLVFFNGRGIHPTRIGHVGLVVSVDSINNTFRFIHAAIKGGICYNNSEEPYYKQRYKGACRVLQISKETIKALRQHIADSLAAEAKRIADSATTDQPTLEQPELQQPTQPKNITHIVKKGDNLYRLSKKYGCTIEDLQRWNKLKNDNINIGQRIVIHKK